MSFYVRMLIICDRQLFDDSQLQQFTQTFYYTPMNGETKTQMCKESIKSKVW